MVKSKLRNFLRRSFPVITAMLLIALCAAPASAAVSGYWVSPIPFDDVAFLYGEAFERSYRMPYVGNSAGSVFPDTGYVAYKDIDNELLGEQQLLSVTQDNGRISTATYFSYDYTGWGLGFYNYNGFGLRTSLLTSSDQRMIFYSESLPVTGSVSIRFTLNKIVETGGSYSVESKTFTRNNHAFMSTGINLLALMNLAITDISYISSEYTYVSDLDVRFFFDDTEVSEIELRTSWQQQAARSNVSAWVNSYYMPRDVIVNPSDPSGVNFVDWLQVAIGGFLDFELWPGMSLNEIMWVILVVGILFWFFKVTV